MQKFLLVKCAASAFNDPTKLNSTMKWHVSIVQR